MAYILPILIVITLLLGCNKQAGPTDTEKDKQTMARPEQAKAAISIGSLPGEDHLRNIRQLSFGGENAEAYFSYDGSELIFQSTRDALKCDAIFRMSADGTNVRMLSSAKGATTCSYIAPDNKSIIYASTHLGGDACPPRPDYSRGYVWSLYKTYDVFKADADGNNLVRLTDTDGYDAEAVYSPDGKKIIFTSIRSGDLDLYMMNPDGSEVEQITFELGYDGGAFFSRDSQSIVWRTSRPEGEKRAEYKALLAEGLVKPGRLEIYMMNLNDRKPIQLTDNGAANFAPYWHPNGKQIIFASNQHNPRGRNFDLFLLDVESRKVEQVTQYNGFDSFPMFSHDGKYLVFASNRNGKMKGETNIFITQWNP